MLGSSEVRLHWSSVSLTRCEVYFERYHNNALEAVRRASMSILDNDVQSTVTQYGRSSVDRSGGALSIRLSLSKSRTLVIYAKERRRLRFEVQRTGKAGVARSRAPETFENLFRLLRADKRHSHEQVPWGTIGLQFDEPDAPTLADLVAIFRKVFRAAASDADAASETIATLLIDGGIMVDETNNGSIIGALEREGLVARVRLRSRAPKRSAPRFALTEPYASLQRRLRELLPVVAGGISEP
ncbi:hypothetical protein SCH01S_28_00850 [Sphingomonas changbaiensis NBRC 104936]|uniref:Uncharacterized protein n=2 Tax=Sphingomonas changbaiensis TaxID=529705 RepID=A0A0E9MP65_9SPHN|nr:hypothetical protein SCH01S_28_00850 [Sphingomonas changbaiensis NBRC 104936]